MRAAVLALALFTASCCSVTIPPLPSANIADEMASTVLVNIHNSTHSELRMAVDGVDGGLLVGSGESYQESSGSGFIVETRGGRTLIVTAAHVVNHKPGDVEVDEGGGGMSIVNHLLDETITVTGASGSCVATIVLSGDPKKFSDDVAVLECFKRIGPAADLAPWLPVPGSPALTIGFPAGTDWPVPTNGYYVGLDGDGNIEISTPAFHGNSGGPIFVDHQVVGILTMVNDHFHHACYGVGVRDIRRLVEAAR